jgi:hypothetical protein
MNSCCTKVCVIAFSGMFPLAISAQSSAVVLFDFDKYTLTGSGKKLLDSILKISSINLKKIRLYGHTDAVGDFSFCPMEVLPFHNLSGECHRHRPVQASGR